MAKHTGYEDPALSILIHSQHGVLTAAQAKAGGLPHETLRRRVQRGLWQRLVPGVYALQGGPPSRLQWLVAAQLYAGDRSVLTGRAALAVHGVRVPAAHSQAAECASAGFVAEGYGVASDHGPARHRLDALIPHETRRQSVAHLRIIRTTRVPEATRIGVLRVAPLARSTIDGCLAAVEDRQPEAIDAIVTAALESGAVRLAELEYELGKTSRKHSAAIRVELRKSRAHARASAVREFLTRLDTSGPFGAMEDAAVYLGQRRVARVVAVWPERAVAVAVEPHPVEVSTLTSLGFALIRVTSEQLEREPEVVLRQLREALRNRPAAVLPPGIALLPLASAPRKELAHA